MSESKHRKRLEKAEAELLTVLQRHSIVIGDEGLSCVQALLIELDAVEDARKALGYLPPAVEAHVQEALAIRATPKDGKRLPEAVYWEKAPGGRTRLKLVSLTGGGHEFLAELVLDSAAARGYGLKFCAFPSGEWPERIEAAKAEEKRTAKQVAEDLSKSTINLMVLPQGFSLLRVPKMTDESMVSGCVAGTLRLMDNLVASRGAARKSGGVMRISFDGYDEDTREVWDVQENRWFLEAVNEFAPWWSWVAAPGDAMIWTGGLFSTAPTIIGDDDKVAFPVNKRVMREALRISLNEVLDTLKAVGVDPNEPSVFEQAEDMLGAMVASADFADKRYARLMSQEPEVEDDSGSERGSAEAQDVGSFTEKPLVAATPSAPKKSSDAAFLDIALLDFTQNTGDTVASRSEQSVARSQQETAATLRKALAKHVDKASNGARHKSLSFDELLVRSAMAVCVFDKSEHALYLLRQIIRPQDAAVSEVVRWLESDRHFFVLVLERSKALHVAVAKDKGHLLTQVLPNLLAGSNSPEAVLLLTRMAVGTDTDILAWWKEAGGMTLVET